MARCTSFIFCVNLFCHALFTVVGLLSVGAAAAGYYTLLGSANVDHALKILDASSITILIPVAFFLFLGVVLIAIGVFGIVKSRKIEDSPKIMLILAIVIILIVLIIVSLIFVCMYFVGDVESRLDTNMRETISVAAADTESTERENWDNVQESFTCCGVTDGYDWLFQLNSLSWNDTYVPASCGDNEAEKIARPGCKKTVQEDILQITILCCGILALAAGVLAVCAIMMLVVSIKSIRDPRWMRLKNEVKDEFDDEDDDSISDYKRQRSVTDIQQVFQQSEPVSARDVRISGTKGTTPPKKANPVIVR
ncbi:uncharacterized protein LOC142339288 [Convolutriloba macropyga]|uniref:uncharacterized protein LOC142339288 n=1 Tax=Convolutriloba macropyga TaxID=536237 RepID=UPI003F527C26